MITGNALKAKLDDLAREIVTDPEKLAAFAARWQGGFHNYSMHNYLLAMAQRPDVSILASFPAWKARGRSVKKGEKAIWVLAPCTYKRQGVDKDTGEETEVKGLYFRSVPVFDVAQTEGRPLDNLACTPVTGPDSGRAYFNAMANACPVPLKCDSRLNSCYGMTDGRQVWIFNSAERPDSELAHTLAHEIAHCLLHHGEAASDGIKPERSVKELEAEAAAYLVSAAHGFRSEASGLYLGNWRGSPELLKLKATRILSAAERILRAGE